MHPEQTAAPQAPSQSPAASQLTVANNTPPTHTRKTTRASRTSSKRRPGRRPAPNKATQRRQDYLRSLRRQAAAQKLEDAGREFAESLHSSITAQISYELSHTGPVKVFTREEIEAVAHLYTVPVGEVSASFSTDLWDEMEDDDALLACYEYGI